MWLGSMTLAVRRMLLWDPAVLLGVMVALFSRIPRSSSAAAGVAGSRGSSRGGERPGARRRGLSEAFDRMSIADCQGGTGDGERCTAEDSGEQHGSEQGPGRTPQGSHHIATQTSHRASVEPRRSPL